MGGGGALEMFGVMQYTLYDVSIIGANPTLVV